MATSDTIAALLAAPALTPPAGVVPNFDNPPNKNGLAWFVTTFCMVVGTISVFIRLYAKVWIQRKARVEEVLVVLAYGAYWGTAYAGYGMIYTPGYYVHQWNLHNSDLVRPLYLILIYGCSYSAVLPLIKVAILLDWCRIFVSHERRKNVFWWGCMVIIAIQVTWGIACIILLNMQCVPHNAIWEFYLPSKCYTLSKVMLTSACVQVVTDWAMVLLPQRIIWTLQMNWQKKAGVSVIFAVGLLASIASSLRLSTTVTFKDATDTMYFIGPLLFWACAEMTCGFVIFCVPCLPSIIKESGLPSKIKKALGISSVSRPSNSDLVTFGGTGASTLQKKSKSGLNKPDTYYEIDEAGGLPMDEFTATGSQEHLYEQQGKNQIVRTTQIDVSRNTIPSRK